MKFQKPMETTPSWTFVDNTANRRVRGFQTSACTVSRKISSKAVNDSLASSILRSTSQVGLFLALAIVVLVVTHQITSRPNPAVRLPFARNSDLRTQTINPAAHQVSELYLPQALLEIAKNGEFRRILQDRDTQRLDSFVATHHLEDSWFLVRYRPVNEDGSAWLGRVDDFDCKRYQVHSTRSKQPEAWRSNVEVLARVIDRVVGQPPDSLVLESPTETVPQFVAHFDKARVIPVPNSAAEFESISRKDIETWTRNAVLAERHAEPAVLARHGSHESMGSLSQDSSDSEPAMDADLESSPMHVPQVIRTHAGG